MQKLQAHLEITCSHVQASAAYDVRKFGMRKVNCADARAYLRRRSGDEGPGALHASGLDTFGGCLEVLGTGGTPRNALHGGSHARKADQVAGAEEGASDEVKAAILNPYAEQGRG